MKRKELFLVMCLALFGVAFKSSAQNDNTVLGANNPNPAANNVLIGPLAGNTTMTGGTNTFVGTGAGNANTSGSSNTALGYGSFWSNSTGSNNVSISNSSLELNQSGNFNIAIGHSSLRNNVSGSENIGIGHIAGSSSKGNSNIFIGEGAAPSINTGDRNFIAGYYAGHGMTGGSENLFLGHQAGYTPALYPHASTRNTYIGYQSGWGVLTGNNNTFLGTVKVPNGLATATLAGTDTKNTIVLADGEANQRLYIHGGDADAKKNGNTGIGIGSNVIPQNRLEVKSAFINNAMTSSGLRLTNLKNTINPAVNPSNGVLSVDSNGDVIFVHDKVGSGTGSSTILEAGSNIDIIGSGTLANPYTISACNLYTCDGTLSSNRLVNMNNNHLIFNTGGSTTTTGGRVYIGNTNQFTSGAGGNFVTFNDLDPANVRDYRLYVEGGLLTERVKVALRNTGNWADYVFNEDYKLMSLTDLELFVKENNHLPGIDSANDLVKKGLDVAEMQAKQMAKIEELTLYVIEQNKEIEDLKAQMKVLLERR